MSEEKETGNLVKQVVNLVEGRSRAVIEQVTSPIDGEHITVVLDSQGYARTSLQELFDDRAKNPRDRKGTATLTNLDSFIAHVNRFGDDDSAVFAKSDPMSPSVTAVLDYHRADAKIEEGEIYEQGEYRHGRHRSHFAFPLSDEWGAWNAMNGETMSMTDFAAFLENRVLDVAEIEKVPETAKRFVEMMGGAQNIADWSMLTKLAKSLAIYENAYVSEVTNLNNGQVQLVINEEQETEIEGVKANVPTMFFIQIPLFKEGVPYRIPVRLRTRKARGSVSFFYEMWNPERSFMHAFDEAIERIDSETEAQVFYGSPE